MNYVPLLLCAVSLALGASTDEFVAAAKQKYGPAGESAARFLVDNMPAPDKQALSTDFLTQNLELAMQARGEFPWAKAVPDALFFNDVLPYAVFDETRDPWRAQFHAMAKDIVKDCTSATEAAQALNREFFKLVKVHYNTGRKMANQSPKESMALGKATCTGLAIILVDACRAVGIPARAVGTPLWANERGNHTWVEIWDGDWKFTGADEYSQEGMNRGWFVGDAAQAKGDEPLHAIYATSWKKDNLAFPMVWSPTSENVAAVNVTARYAKAAPDAAAPAAAAPTAAKLGVRLFAKAGGERLAASVQAFDATGTLIGEAQTKAGTSDLNDMPRFALPAGSQGTLRFVLGDETREMAFGPYQGGDPTADVLWSDLPTVTPATTALEAWLKTPVAERKADAPALKTALTKAEAVRATSLLVADRVAQLTAERKDEMIQKSIVIGAKTLRWLEKTSGNAPAGERSLWISMHGGGGAPAQVNDQQWENQIHLYNPAEGIYVAPRAPTDAWNMWHDGDVDALFDRLIDDMVALRGVSPDKVYLMGYSAGGDGVWKLAPRMADRFAAAAMMAGHPNGAPLISLRNLPFAIFVGGEDAAYDRNKIDAARAAELDRLEKEDPGAYVHMSRVYPGLPHWMNGKDAEAVPWMAQYKRNPWPKKVIWVQDGQNHERFYWLKIPDVAAAKGGDKIVATAKDSTITLEGDVPAKFELALSDELLDLDKPVTVTVTGKKPITQKVTRSAGAILRSLEKRLDGPSAATAWFALP